MSVQTEVLRSDDARFAQLPDYAYAPAYLDDLAGFAGLRIHYLDVGASGTGPTFLCLHGEPTWSYLYRKMIPVFVQAGQRAVAPDFLGFGKSDKPTDESFYSFSRHREFLLRFIERLDLREITLVCQDWGGLLGLTLPMEMPERFTGLLVMNTALGAGDAPLTQGFLDWRAYVARNSDLACGKLLKRSCPHLSEAEAAAYDAPFPDERYKAGVRRFPQLVPDHADADGAALSRRARDWWRNAWRGRAFMAIGMRDPVLGAPVMHGLCATIRDCPPPLELADAGHFVPEWGEAVARAALRAWR